MESFLISIDPKSQYYSLEFARECEAENIKEFDDSLIERILYFKCGTFETDVCAFNYLLHVYRTSSEKQLVMNYVGLVLDNETSDLFGFSSKIGFRLIIDKLLENQNPEDDFLQHFFKSYSNQILDLIKYLNSRMRQKWITDTDLKAFLTCFSKLMEFSEVVTVLVQDLEFIPSQATAKTIQDLSLFGPFLSNSSVFPDGDPKLLTNWFSSYGVNGECLTVNGVMIGNRNFSDVESAQKNLVYLADFVSKIASSTIFTIIKSGSEGKARMLEFFSTVLKLNKDRGKLQMDLRQVATNGFMYNISRICLALCDPLLDHYFTKFHLIRDSCLFLTEWLDVQQDTRIHADQTQADDFHKELKDSENQSANFVSEIFFLTLSYHHYGILSIIRYSGNLGKQLDKMKEQVEKLRQDELSGAWNGPMQAMYSNQFKNFQNQFDKLIGEKLAIDGVLLDKHNVTLTLKFYNLAILWLIRCAASETVPINDFNRMDLPDVIGGGCKNKSLMSLKPQPPKLFCMVPEWIFDDICEFYLHVLRVKTNYFETISRNEIVTFALVFLCNSSYLRNPYLKSKLVEILYHFTHALYQDTSGRKFGSLNDIFRTHDFAQENLIHCLTKFYIDVEQSGMHSQFYEKFSIRYHISQIFKSVWEDSQHRKMFIRESKNKEQFVRFAALLMNDTTYLLDESLSKLKEIQTIQNELELPLVNASQEDQEARNQKIESLAQYEKQALSTMSLGRETVNMFEYLTSCSEMIDPFMAPEVVDRLAAMLNFNLVALCGPRCSELKVREPEKYRFNPKELLNNIVQIYMNLSQRVEFISAVAKDGRSYSKQLFYKAGSILFKHALKKDAELQVLYKFVDHVEERIKSEVSQEEELGEVPEEFLDPLLFTLMEEPVILPSSQVTVDLATIKSHLLSDNHDPFNRQPLKIEDVIPNVDLKAKITAWRASAAQKTTKDYFALISSTDAWSFWSKAAKETEEMDDILYGVETVINSSLVQEMNPLIFGIIELVLTQVELPLPPSQIPIGSLGAIKVVFNDTRCHGVRIYKTLETTGVFFDTDLVGLTFTMDLKCAVNFSTNLRFLKNGNANITITGVNPFAQLGLAYLSDTKQATPVLKTFDIKFTSIDAVMDKHPFANIFLKMFHHLLPPIVSFSMKTVVKSLVPRISALLLDPKIGITNNHGTVDQYHVVINETPVFTKQYARFNVSLESGEGNAFTALKDVTKKPPFELYLEGYKDGSSGKFYCIQGLDVEKEFKEELDSHKMETENLDSHKMETENLDPLPPKKRPFRAGFSKKFEDEFEDKSKSIFHSPKNYKYF